MATSTLVSWISEPLPLRLDDLSSSLHFSLSETSSSSVDQSFFPPWIPSDPGNYMATTRSLTGLAQPLALTDRVTKRKRKSRASKKNLTTYISTDAANFRDMVQHVTGVGYEFGETEPDLISPEPKRTAPMEQPNCVLPTLDTSALLLERSDQTVSGLAGSVRNTVYQMDPFSYFPTLESWGVM